MYSFFKKSVARTLLFVRDALNPFFSFEEVGILAYHAIGEYGISMAITQQKFRAQLEYLKQQGYAFVSLMQIRAWQRGEGRLPLKSVAITFDDGYADFETAALPVLEALSVPVALFVMGDLEASRAHVGNELSFLSHEALLRVHNHTLVTIGYHSRTHTNLSRLNKEKLAEEISSPSSEQWFAYPGGAYSQLVMEEVERQDYDSAYSIKPILVTRSNNRFLMPRSVVTRDMSLSEVRFHVTKALSWYRSLSRLFR